MAEIRCGRCGVLVRKPTFCVVLDAELTTVEFQYQLGCSVTLCEDCKARLLEFLNVEDGHE